MDTSTHVVMGIGIGGLAMLDPVVAGHTATTEAVLISAFLGSQAPDIDTILKGKNNAIYIRNHRGVTHSIPAILLWSVLIPAIIMLFIPAANALHVWLWTLLAVFLHVFVDIFNAYGTQALRPFSQKWVRLGIINIFDPVIFGAHVLGIILWVSRLTPPGLTFLYIYAGLSLYYIWRVWAHHRVKQRIMSKMPEAEYIDISPSFRWHYWHVAVRTPTTYMVAKDYKRTLQIVNTFNREPLSSTDLLTHAEKDKNIQAFLTFSPIHRWEVYHHPDYDEIRFTDLRYRNKHGYYPFVAVAFIDDHHQVISSYTGWIYSESKLQKKLRVAMAN